MRRARPARAEPARVGWVLAGGGARGPYEIGVLDYLFDRVAAELRRPLPIDVVCGTSIGAIHACGLAASADDPGTAVRAFADQWTSLKIEDVIHVDKRRAFNMLRALLGHPPRKASSDANRGGILDTRPLEALLTARLDFGRITDQIRSGRLQAASVSATNVATGRTTVFFQRGGKVPALQPWGRTSAIPVTLGAGHVMASSAIPFLFPSVRIKGEMYCDGSLRQHVPLSPARRLGAEAIVVINPRALSVDDGVAADRPRPKLFPGPLFLLGKTLNALTLDRVDGDIEQLELINRLLSAGERRFGSTFVQQLNEELAQVGAAPIAAIPLLQVQASEDIGRMSADYVRSRQFRARHGTFIENRFTRMARGDTANEADFLSYLLFDGGFARQLIDLGRRDAQRKHDEIMAFFGAQGEGSVPRRGGLRWFGRRRCPGSPPAPPTGPPPIARSLPR